MQHAGHTGPCAKALGGRSDGHDRLCRRPEQQAARFYQKAICVIPAGMVKTKWKYQAGSRSSTRAAIQSRTAGPWHLGQCPALGSMLCMRLPRNGVLKE